MAGEKNEEIFGSYKPDCEVSGTKLKHMNLCHTKKKLKYMNVRDAAVLSLDLKGMYIFHSIIAIVILYTYLFSLAT